MLFYCQNVFPITQHTEYIHSSNRKYRFQGIENIFLGKGNIYGCAVQILNYLHKNV